MKRYVVTLQKSERDELQQITYKGSHSSQKVINSLILLNCDEGPFIDRRESGTAIAGILRISPRKVERVKKRFVEEGLWKQHLGGVRTSGFRTCARPTVNSRRIWWR